MFISKLPSAPASPLTSCIPFRRTTKISQSANLLHTKEKQVTGAVHGADLVLPAHLWGLVIFSWLRWGSVRLSNQPCMASSVSCSKNMIHIKETQKKARQELIKEQRTVCRSEKPALLLVFQGGEGEGFPLRASSTEVEESNHIKK